MAKGSVRGVLPYLRRVLGPPGDPGGGDRELLARFAAARDEAAFAALVGRHGPLVWGVCARLLPRAEDAEDAFQATFLVLAKKAAAVPWRRDVGNWLYAVATRVARKARGGAARRHRREGGTLPADVPAAAPAAPDPALPRRVD